jgi:hypothetical protein
VLYDDCEQEEEKEDGGICSSETSLYFYWASRGCIPKYSKLPLIFSWVEFSRESWEFHVATWR